MAILLPSKGLTQFATSFFGSSGGVYADLDVLSCKPIDPLLIGQQCVLGLEPKEHAKKFSVQRIIGNAFRAAEASHGFFELVTRRLKDFAAQRGDDASCILKSTGPLMLTKLYDEFDDKTSVAIERSGVLFPLNADEAKVIRSSGIMNVDVAHAYTIHYFFGTWWSAERVPLGVLPGRS